MDSLTHCSHFYLCNIIRTILFRVFWNFWYKMHCTSGHQLNADWLRFNLGVHVSIYIYVICTEQTPAQTPTTTTFDVGLLGYMDETSHDDDVQDDFDKYLATDTTSTTNCITFWQEYKKKSNALYQLHLMHHVIPATSAATERAFSAAGLIVSDRRNRLDVNIVESLLLAKCNSDLFWVFSFDSHFYILFIFTQSLLYCFRFVIHLHVHVDEVSVIRRNRFRMQLMIILINWQVTNYNSN